MLMHLINVALPELISDENFPGAISVCLTPFPFVNLHDDSANNTWWHCLTVSRTISHRGQNDFKMALSLGIHDCGRAHA